VTRLIQVMAGAPQGGAELYFVRLAAALQRAGLDQRIVMRPHSALLQPLEDAGVDVTPAPFGGPFDLKTPRILRREIEVFKPDLVLSYMQRASAMVPEGDFLQIGRLGGYYDLKYFRRCDHLVVNTPDIAEHCARLGWPRDRLQVISNFVEDRRAAAPLDRGRLDTPEGAPLVFALGRLHENKAFDTLLRALAALPGAYLWLAGEGPERKALEALAEDLGIAERLRFLGWQDDPWPYFAAADLMIVPSRHEPLGNVVLEGWMMGRPMVAAASQGPSWLITDEESGLLVPIDDAPAMAAALSRLIEDRGLAERLARQGRARYEAGFTEEAVVGQYLAFFEKVISASRN
jgi:glycosyltransferase involved in cell wall biosynthesis